jgi:uncharacterized protein (DUF111 family)
LRVVLADTVLAAGLSADGIGPEDVSEQLVELVCDIDDMSPEYLAAMVERAREAGALDVTLLPVTMKRGRAGTRIELLCRPGDARRFEELLLVETTSIGVRTRSVMRRALPRSVIEITVLGQRISAKLVTLPNGRRRAKPEFVDVERVALAMGRPSQDISRLAAIEAERYSDA